MIGPAVTSLDSLALIERASPGDEPGIVNRVLGGVWSWMTAPSRVTNVAQAVLCPSQSREEEMEARLQALTPHDPRLVNALNQFVDQLLKKWEVAAKRKAEGHPIEPDLNSPLSYFEKCLVSLGENVTPENRGLLKSILYQIIIHVAKEEQETLPVAERENAERLFKAVSKRLLETILSPAEELAGKQEWEVRELAEEAVTKLTGYVKSDRWVEWGVLKAAVWWYRDRLVDSLTSYYTSVQKTQEMAQGMRSDPRYKDRDGAPGFEKTESVFAYNAQYNIDLGMEGIGEAIEGLVDDPAMVGRGLDPAHKEFFSRTLGQAITETTAGHSALLKDTFAVVLGVLGGLDKPGADPAKEIEKAISGLAPLVLDAAIRERGWIEPIDRDLTSASHLTQVMSQLRKWELVRKEEDLQNALKRIGRALNPCCREEVERASEAFFSEDSLDQLVIHIQSTVGDSQNLSHVLNLISEIRRVRKERAAIKQARRAVKDNPSYENLLQFMRVTDVAGKNWFNYFSTNVMKSGEDVFDPETGKEMLGLVLAHPHAVQVADHLAEKVFKPKLMERDPSGELYNHVRGLLMSDAVVEYISHDVAALMHDAVLHTTKHQAEEDAAKAQIDLLPQAEREELENVIIGPAVEATEKALTDMKIPFYKGFYTALVGIQDPKSGSDSKLLKPMLQQLYKILVGKMLEGAEGTNTHEKLLDLATRGIEAMENAADQITEFEEKDYPEQKEMIAQLILERPWLKESIEEMKQYGIATTDREAMVQLYYQVQMEDLVQVVLGSTNSLEGIYEQLPKTVQRHLTLADIKAILFATLSRGFGKQMHSFKKLADEQPGSGHEIDPKHKRLEKVLFRFASNVVKKLLEEKGHQLEGEGADLNSFSHLIQALSKVGAETVLPVGSDIDASHAPGNNFLQRVARSFVERALKRTQANAPHLFHDTDFVPVLLGEAVADVEAFLADQYTPTEVARDGDLFAKTLAEKLLNVAFPDGAEDLRLNESADRNFAFKTMKEKLEAIIKDQMQAFVTKEGRKRFIIAQLAGQLDGAAGDAKYSSENLERLSNAQLDEMIQSLTYEIALSKVTSFLPSWLNNSLFKVLFFPLILIGKAVIYAYSRQVAGRVIHAVSRDEAEYFIRDLALNVTSLFDQVQYGRVSVKDAKRKFNNGLEGILGHLGVPFASWVKPDMDLKEMFKRTTFVDLMESFVKDEMV